LHLDSEGGTDDDAGLTLLPAYCYDPQTTAPQYVVGDQDGDGDAEDGADEIIRKKQQEHNIWSASFLCQKERVSPISPTNPDTKLMHPAVVPEDQFVTPTCYNPAKYPDTDDLCQGVVPRGADYLAARVTCLEPASSYNVSLQFVKISLEVSHQYRGRLI
jgi:hypothetical protein